MFHQLRSSNRKRDKYGEFCLKNLKSFTNGNQTRDNVESHQSNTVYNVEKQQKLISKAADHSNVEMQHMKNDNIEVSFLKEPLDQKVKKVSIRKHYVIDQTKFKNKNTQMKILKQKNMIVNIPKKRFRSNETIVLIPFRNDLSNISSEQTETGSCDRSNPLDVTHEIEDAQPKKYSKPSTKDLSLKIRSSSIDESNYESDATANDDIANIVWHSDITHNKKTKKPKGLKNSKRSSKQSKVLLTDEKLNAISTDIPLDPHEQSSFSTMNQEAPFTEDSLIPNSIPDPPNGTNIINETTALPFSLPNQCSMTMPNQDHSSEEQENGIAHQYQPNWSSTCEVNLTNSVPSNSATSNVVQDVTEQTSIPISYINSQPLFANMFGVMDNRQYSYLPLNTMHTCVIPSSIEQICQKIDKIQESMQIMNNNLSHIVQTQEELQNTQNSIKIELQNLKIQTLAYENREKWLAENGITLPLNSREEFTRFCTLLELSPECRKILEISIHFAISSKRSLTRNIASIIRKYLVCRLANQFTAVRYVKDKDVLANTSFYKHLLKNFLEKSANGVIYPGLTETDFNKALGEVLCNVKDCTKKKLSTE